MLNIRWSLEQGSIRQKSDLQDSLFPEKEKQAKLAFSKNYLCINGKHLYLFN